ncbi:MAG: TRAP transporter large permease [Alphaproteobacteria bacterium]|nr:TRAP transporter large permease [Alphaproteobacteria bacterium]
MVIVALFALMTVLLFTGLEIWVAIGLAALLPMMIFNLAPLEVLPQMMMSSIDSWVLLAVPFFILAGAIIAETSIGQRLVDLFNALFGALPGGLAISAVFTCVVFGGLTGSATAEAAGVTAIMTRPMERAGYPRPYVASLIAAAGTLANLIPPSIALLVYGIVAKVSISDLFLAGVVPGIVNALLLAITAVYVAERRGYGRASAVERMPIGRAIWRSAWALLAPVWILGGIRLGLFTPTESAIFITLYVFIVAKYVYRDITWRQVPAIVERAAVTSVAVMLIIATAAVLSWLIETQGLAAAVLAFLKHMQLSRTMVIVGMIVILVVAGMVLEPAPMLLIIVPILLPVVRDIGLDLVQFGIFVTVGINLGLIHPPVGLTLFVSAKVAEAPLLPTFYASLWWLPAFFLLFFLVAFVPGLSLALL